MRHRHTRGHGDERAPANTITLAVRRRPKRRRRSWPLARGVSMRRWRSVAGAGDTPDVEDPGGRAWRRRSLNADRCHGGRNARRSRRALAEDSPDSRRVEGESPVSSEAASRGRRRSFPQGDCRRGSPPAASEARPLCLRRVAAWTAWTRWSKVAACDEQLDVDFPGTRTRATMPNQVGHRRSGGGGRNGSKRAATGAWRLFWRLRSGSTRARPLAPSLGSRRKRRRTTAAGLTFERRVARSRASSSARPVAWSQINERNEE